MPRRITGSRSITCAAPRRIPGGGGNPPKLSRLADGRIVLVYGARKAPYGIRARTSQDEGKTWGEEKLLRQDGGSRDLGYPRCVALEDGTLVTVYYFNENNEAERFIGATIWEP